MSGGENGILSRWARRKQKVREEDQEIARVEAEAVAEEEQHQALMADPDQREEPPDEETRQKWVEELEEIDIDALTYDSDFTIFMKTWVPGPLRNRALRKLWSTNPELAVLDGLNDYDLDYTDAAMQAGKVVSSWNPQTGYAKLEELVDKIAGDDEADTDETLDVDDDAGEDDMPEFEGEGNGDGTEEVPALAQEAGQESACEPQKLAGRPAGEAPPKG